MAIGVELPDVVSFSRIVCFTDKAPPTNLQQASISNFAALSKITIKA